MHNKFNNILLFLNHEKYSESMSDSAFLDLNIDIIADFLLKLNCDFPINLLKRPVENSSDAKFRVATLSEILKSHKIYNALYAAMLKLKKLCYSVDSYQDEQNEERRKLLFLSCLLNYKQTVTALCDATSSAKSIGLVRLHDLCFKTEIESSFVSICNRAENAYLKTKKLQDNLGVKTDMKITAYFSDSEDHNLQRLASLLSEIYGVKTLFDGNIYKNGDFDSFEEKIFEIVKRDNATLFYEIDKIYRENGIFDEKFEEIRTLYPQLCFYLTLVDMYRTMEEHGVSICEPTFTEGAFCAEECISPAFFVMLYSTNRLINIVPNNVALKKNNAAIITGANQGGKTVYLKTIGQLSHLARCGCLITAKFCRLPLYDVIETHFLKPEKYGQGRLAEEILRIENIFKKLTNNSLVLFNESFNTTRRIDGLRIATHYIKNILEKGATVVFVTHFAELYDSVNYREKTIELCAETNEDGKRSYRIIADRGEGNSCAHDVVKKCGMTYCDIIAELNGGEK